MPARMTWNSYLKLPPGGTVFCVTGVPSLALSSSMPCQWMLVSLASRRFSRMTTTLSPTVRLKSGPGTVPL